MPFNQSINTNNNKKRKKYAAIQLNGINNEPGYFYDHFTIIIII